MLTSSEAKADLLQRNHSTKIKIRRHGLTHLQCSADTLKDDGVHAKSHRTCYTGILPIALQELFGDGAPSLRRCVRPKKTFTIKVNQVRRRIGHPHFGFPCDLTQILAHDGAVRECGHVNQSSF